MFDEELVTDASIYHRARDIGGAVCRAVKAFIKTYPASESRSKQKNLELFLNLIKKESYTEPSDKDIAVIFACSEKTIQRARNSIKSTEPEETSPKRGAPPKFPPTLMPELILWVKERTFIGTPPTREELTTQAEQMMIDNGYEPNLSRSWIDSLLRSNDSPFKKIMSVPLEEERFNVTEEDVVKWIELLTEVNLCSYDPRLIINLDETGFGSSSGSKSPKLKVIVCKEESDTINYLVPRTDQHVTAIVAISAKGKMFKPALLHRNKTLAPDAEKCFFYKGAYYYQSKNAFVNKAIYEDYINREIIPEILKIYQTLPEEQRKAALIVDGHTSHFSEELKAVLATHNIAYLCMPSHSSHILQPLDRFFFSVVKRAYRSKTKRTDITANSALLEKCYTSLLTAAIEPTIITSFSRAGIIPVMKEGEVVSIEVSVDKLIHGQWSLMEEQYDDHEEEQAEKIKEKALRKKVKFSNWGLMNAEQKKRIEERKCPFCGKPLDTK